MNKNFFYVLIFILYIIVFQFCESKLGEKTSHNYDLLVNRNVITEYSGEGIYMKHFLYSVDSEENVYIANRKSKSIKKYNKKGNLLCNFGRRGEGPGEFPSITKFCINEKGEIIVLANSKLIIFDSDCKFKTIVRVPIKKIKGYIYDLKSISDDKILFSVGVMKNKYNYIIFNYKNMKTKILRTDKNRIYPDNIIPAYLLHFTPDMGVGNSGRIYIADSYYYKIYVYSDSGELVKSFSKVYKNVKVNFKKDFKLPKGVKVSKAEKTIKNKKEETSKKAGGKFLYYPAILALNIENEKIYVWTNETDNKGRYIIDIYDRNFKYLYQRSFYNYRLKNEVYIINDYVFIPKAPKRSLEFSSVGRGINNYLILNSEKIYKYKILQ